MIVIFCFAIEYIILHKSRIVLKFSNNFLVFFLRYALLYCYSSYIFKSSRIFGTAIATSAFLNLLIPKSAQIHESLVIIVRILQGLVEVSNTTYFCRELFALNCFLTFSIQIEELPNTVRMRFKE